jgi:hypothetical protein
MQENVNIPDSTITTNLSFRQLVLMNMQQLTNFPYIEKDFDALTDYELLCLVVKFLNDVIANQNEQNDSITRMYESFLALQTYVNNTKDTLEDAFNNLDDYVRNYFDNLDVQEEINNKLDEMLEDGVLEQIIEQFIQSTALWCFNTVADLIDATNLIDGSYARTLGYYSVNDGGGATYRITNNASASEYQETLDSGLYATLIIDNNFNVQQIGAYGDDTHNDYQKITEALNINENVKFNNKTYLIESTLDLSNKNCNIDGIIHYTGNNYAIELTSGNEKTLNINKIISNGGGIKIHPTNPNSYSFIHINVDLIQSNNHTIYMDATNGIITNIYLRGIRWASLNESNVKMYIGANAYSSTFLTEIKLYDVDLLSGTAQQRQKAIDCEVIPTTGVPEIEYALLCVDLENSIGIVHKGKVLTANLIDCRLIELLTREGCIEFYNRVPNYMHISGVGTIYPANIKYYNITGDKKVIETDLGIVDTSWDIPKGYPSGGIIGTNCFTPNNPNNAPIYKTISEADIVNDKYEYQFNKGQGYINGIALPNSPITDLEVIIPYSLTNNVLCEPFVVYATNVVTNFKLTYKNGGSKTVTNLQYAMYLFIPYTNSFRVIKLQ